MHVGRKAQKREKKAMSVSLYGNLFFVIVEIVMAIYTSSQAVLLDAIYDGVEFCMLLPSLFLIPLLYKPSNEKHPFGYMQIESMFVVVKGITMTGVTVGLILNNIEIMIHGGRKVAFDTIAWFELFAFFLGITVSIYLKYKNRLMDSPLITMEMEGWEIDSIASFGMAIAFFLPVLLPFPWFRPITPYLDQIITVTLSIFMLPTPIKTVITGLRDLFLIPPEEETVDEIKESVALDTDLKTWANAIGWKLSNEDEAVDIYADYDFDPENIQEGIYQVTFSTEGRELKVHTTDYVEEGQEVGLTFEVEDIHVMEKMGF